VSINVSSFAIPKKKVDWLNGKLNDHGFPVVSTHGDLNSEERISILKKFVDGAARILVTTDLLARGIDVQHVSIVINYDIPIYKETYMHRIGRSGRFGRKGVAINFITKQDVTVLQELEQFYCIRIEELPNNIADLL